MDTDNRDDLDQIDFLIHKCTHKSRSCLSSKIQHYICHDCGTHWYRGNEISKKRWELWIESTNDKYPWEE